MEPFCFCSYDDINKPLKPALYDTIQLNFASYWRHSEIIEAIFSNLLSWNKSTLEMMSSDKMQTTTCLCLRLCIDQFSVVLYPMTCFTVLTENFFTRHPSIKSEKKEKVSSDPRERPSDWILKFEFNYRMASQVTNLAILTCNGCVLCIPPL